MIWLPGTKDNGFHSFVHILWITKSSKIAPGYFRRVAVVLLITPDLSVRKLYLDQQHVMLVELFSWPKES